MTIAIVGAGIAGLACAQRLVASGRPCTLFDKGRRPGGRLSTRRMATLLGEATFDHGAQYFTVRDPAFRARVEAWRDQGLAAPWPAAGHDAFVGVPAMDAPVAAIAGALDVRPARRVDALRREAGGWRLAGEGIGDEPYEAVVVTVPAEQVGALVAPWDAGMAARAAAVRSEPCWTLMAAFAERLPIAADVVKHRGAIGWATRNNAKPGRSGPEAWVIQAGADWSRAHLEMEPAEATAAVLDAFARAVDIAVPEPMAAAAHRWRYARSGEGGPGPMWNAALGLGACGDWAIGPRVESAWASGHRLAGAMLAG